MEADTISEHWASRPQLDHLCGALALCAEVKPDCRSRRKKVLESLKRDCKPLSTLVEKLSDIRDIGRENLSNQVHVWGVTGCCVVGSNGRISLVEGSGTAHVLCNIVGLDIKLIGATVYLSRLPCCSCVMTAISLGVARIQVVEMSTVDRRSILKYGDWIEPAPNLFNNRKSWLKSLREELVSACEKGELHSLAASQRDKRLTQLRQIVAHHSIKLNMMHIPPDSILMQTLQSMSNVLKGRNELTPDAWCLTLSILCSARSELREPLLKPKATLVGSVVTAPKRLTTGPLVQAETSMWLHQCFNAGLLAGRRADQNNFDTTHHHNQYFEMGFAAGCRARESCADAAIVTPIRDFSTNGFVVVGIGYNAYPGGLRAHDAMELEMGGDIHAEHNAAMSAMAYGRAGVPSWTVYVTDQPCAQCTRLFAAVSQKMNVKIVYLSKLPDDRMGLQFAFQTLTSECLPLQEHKDAFAHLKLLRSSPAVFNRALRMVTGVCSLKQKALNEAVYCDFHKVSAEEARDFFSGVSKHFGSWKPEAFAVGMWLSMAAFGSLTDKMRGLLQDNESKLNETKSKIGSWLKEHIAFEETDFDLRNSIETIKYHQSEDPLTSCLGCGAYIGKHTTFCLVTVSAREDSVPLCGQCCNYRAMVKILRGRRRKARMACLTVLRNLESKGPVDSSSDDALDSDESSDEMTTPSSSDDATD